MQTGTKQDNQGAAPSALGDSPKPHGDKLAAGEASKVTASQTGQTGDSPKRQGDKLDHAVQEASRR